jgi:tRNA uracil 4-sulfurtransferase
MMTKKILIRFGDLMLKGKNIKTFTRKIIEHVDHKLKIYNVQLIKQHDRLYISYDANDELEIIKKLKEVAGIASFSVVYEATLEIDDIVDKAVWLIQDQFDINESKRFKIDTKRANKRFPLTSQEATKVFAPLILNKADRPLVVDVKNPEETLSIEIRNEATYLFLRKIKGMGGFPAFSGDKAIVMISGGIDSPVSAYLALKQGVKVELMHFESSPLTPLESAQKVVDLAKKISVFTPKDIIKLHMVPFTEIHKKILEMVPEAYSITVMRRMMYKIAERYALIHDCHALINGESIGQVASQTLQSMRAIESVTRLPILRPLITTNKADIVKIAKEIDTFNISIKPFNDCCSIYVPQRPATKPRDYIVARYESLFDEKGLSDAALENIITLDITPETTLTLADYGFMVDEALRAHEIEKSEVI